MSAQTNTAENTVTEVTRLAIQDALRLEDISFNGDLGEIEFLWRVFDLNSLPSWDPRFTNIADDIWQHRINNPDWEDNYWVFADSRFNLNHGPDEVFLRFLAEMVHPIVRRDKNQAVALVKMLNQHLAPDGWELAEQRNISGRPVYRARRLVMSQHAVQSARAVAEAIDADYINRQITRLETSVEQDPDLAIGTAKEFVETVCKTILEERGVRHDESSDFSKLVRKTLNELKLVPDGIQDQAKASDTIKVLLNNLATISNGLAEIRNRFGTGHGKLATTSGARPRHARLAVGAAATLAVFMFETHQER